jgi:phosphoribosylformylglycinamidine (FGAM) synthase-like enzyme
MRTSNVLENAVITRDNGAVTDLFFPSSCQALFMLMSDYTGYKGEIMSLGERAPLALCDASAAARMTIGEALTNMCG